MPPRALKNRLFWELFHEISFYFSFVNRLSHPLCCGVKLIVKFPHSHTNYSADEKNYESFNGRHQQWQQQQQKESFTILHII